MGSCCIPGHSYSSNESPFIYSFTRFYEDLRKMKIARIIFPYLPLIFHILVLYSYIFIIWIIFASHNFSMPYSKYRSANRCSNIYPIMRSCIWGSIFIHVTTSKNCEVCKHAVKICHNILDRWNGYEIILIDDSIIQGAPLIYIICLFPIGNKS